MYNNTGAETILTSNPSSSAGTFGFTYLAFIFALLDILPSQHCRSTRSRSPNHSSASLVNQKSPPAASRLLTTVGIAVELLESNSSQRQWRTSMMSSSLSQEMLPPTKRMARPWTRTDRVRYHQTGRLRVKPTRKSLAVGKRAEDRMIPRKRVKRKSPSALPFKLFRRSQYVFAADSQPAHLDIHLLAPHNPHLWTSQTPNWMHPACTMMTTGIRWRASS
jgi:hypothetical protein